jgi:N-sulfoglucosamine sulfohydrolase
MKAMNSAAKDDPSMAARIDLFRYRVPEEFYDLEKDSNCLVNLIDSPEYRPMIAKMKEKLESYMIKTNDPMLEAFRNSDDRTIVDKVIRDMYGNTNANKSRKRK